MLLLLLNDDAAKLAGWELLPAAALATPVAGRLNVPITDSVPRIVAPPLTSSVVAGEVVPMPILTVAPLPLWLMPEFSMSVAVLHSGMEFTVPPEVVTPEVVRGVPVLEAALEDEATLVRVAKTKADGGNPPIVSASAAFNA